jgi:flagellar protein FlaG
MQSIAVASTPVITRNAPPPGSSRGANDAATAATATTHPAAADAGDRPSPRPDEQTARAAARTLNDHLMKPPLEARYAKDEQSGIIVIKIVNQKSGEVLRQIPDVAAVHLARALTATARTGAAHNLVDETA